MKRFGEDPRLMLGEPAADDGVRSLPVVGRSQRPEAKEVEDYMTGWLVVDRSH